MTSIYTKEQVYAIANTIWLQLGSNRFSLITGCNPITYGEKDGKVFLLMSVGKNNRAINRFEVSYNEGMDTYEVRFIRKRGGEAHIVAEHKDVYCGMLSTLFEQHTGMITSFPKIAC